MTVLDGVIAVKAVPGISAIIPNGLVVYPEADADTL